MNQQLTNLGLTALTESSSLDALLNTLLIRDNGSLLREAQRKALGNHAVVEMAAELPAAMEMEEACPASLRNVYGIYPPGLNTWERDFAEYLDHAPANTVLP